MKKFMKKQNMTMNSILFTLVMGLTLVLIHPVWGDTAKKVAIVPLEMNATQDLSFLQKGLFSMLSARISDPGKVEMLLCHSFTLAIQSISIKAPLGSMETSTVLREGLFSPRHSPYSSFTVPKSFIFVM